MKYSFIIICIEAKAGGEHTLARSFVHNLITITPNVHSHTHRSLVVMYCFPVGR